MSTIDERPDRPLRADAERNRQRILAAARELFAEQGLSVSLDDVARHAGLGVGTVYRRFPEKDLLIDALFESRIEDIRTVGLAALEVEDPWEGLVALLTGSIELQVKDRGLKELLMCTDRGRERVREARQRIAPIGAAVFERAQRAGVLRTDVSVNDVPMIHLMIGGVIDAARDVEPELWRRLLAVVLDGLRPEAAAAGVGLPVPPLEEEALQAVMRRRRDTGCR